MHPALLPPSPKPSPSSLRRWFTAAHPHTRLAQPQPTPRAFKYQGVGTNTYFKRLVTAHQQGPSADGKTPASASPGAAGAARSRAAPGASAGGRRGGANEATTRSSRRSEIPSVPPSRRCLSAAARLPLSPCTHQPVRIATASSEALGKNSAGPRAAGERRLFDVSLENHRTHGQH